MQDQILAILFRLFKESGSPWITTEELRFLLSEQGSSVAKEEIATTIQKLEKKGYIEVKSVASNSLDRGFIARLSMQGRNILVHETPSLTGI